MSSSSRGARLLWASGVLVVLSIALVLAPKRERPQPFQRATGGIGLSSAVSAAWSFFAFDPRTESACENELWPIPGLPCPNPTHGASASALPPMPSLRR